MNIGLMSILSRLPMMGGAGEPSSAAAPPLLDGALFQGMMAQSQTAPTPLVATPQTSGVIPLPVAVTVVAEEDKDQATGLLDAAPAEGSVDVVAALNPDGTSQEQASTETPVVVMEVSVSADDALMQVVAPQIEGAAPVVAPTVAVASAVDVLSVAADDAAWQGEPEGLPAAVVYSPANLKQQVTVNGVTLEDDGSVAVDFEVEPVADAAVIQPETVTVVSPQAEVVAGASVAVATVVPVMAAQNEQMMAQTAAAPVADATAAARPVMAAALPAELAGDEVELDADGGLPARTAATSSVDDSAFDEAVDEVIQRILDARPQTSRVQNAGNPLVHAHSDVLQQQAVAQALSQDVSGDTGGAEGVDLQLSQPSVTQTTASNDKTHTLPLLHSKAYVTHEKPAVSEQVLVTIRQAVKTGIDHLVVQLDPVDLGQVEVRMDFKDGKATVMMIVENRETLAALQRDARGLEQALQQAGIQADAGAMEFHLQSNGRDGGEGEDGSYGSAFGGAEDEAVEAAEAELYTPVAQYSVGVESGLDIKV